MHRIIIAATILFCLAEFVSADDTRDVFYPGRLVLEADHDVICLPADIRGIVFDTVRDSTEVSNPPAWSFLGPLHVDSLLTRNARIPLERPAQLEGIRLGPPEMLNILWELRVRVFFKSYPDRVPEDTLRWDSDHGKWQKLPDLSRFYRILFSEEYPLDSAKARFSAVPQVGAGRVGIPAVDD